MIPVNLYGNIKNLDIKPSTYTEFCEKIINLFQLNPSANITYEYKVNNNKSFPLDMYNYRFFYYNNNVEGILVYTSFKEGISSINLKSLEKENDSLENNNNLCSNKIIIDGFENNKVDNSNFQTNLANYYINQNFEQLKNELINESQALQSKIIMESKIQNQKNNNILDIKTPRSVENHNTLCNSCGCQIIGIRYRCAYCQNIDYCENCEEKKGISHGHPFYKLRFIIN